MARNITKFSIFLTSLAFVLLPLFFQLTLTSFSSETGVVYAQSGGVPGSGAELQNPLNFDDLVSVIVAIANVLLILAVPIIIIFIVYAGFLYVTAQGNSTKIQDAHNALLYALIGGAIILGAKVISAIIANTVNSISAP